MIHAVTQLRLTVTAEVARLLGWFDEPLDAEAALPHLAATLGFEEPAVQACIASLLERGLLTSRSAEAERADVQQDLAAVHGRDPTVLLDRYRRANAEGSHPYWAVAVPQGIEAACSPLQRIDVLLFGDCDVQIETDFLRQEAKRRGVDLRVAAAFANDFDLARERRHDLVVVGALQARHAIALGEPAHHGGDVTRVYVDAAKAMLDGLRAVTAAPILIDGLPEPTVQPRGFADRGVNSHRNRFRLANLALEQLAETYADVYVVDVAAALGGAGACQLLDDALVSFTHFGSMGWMLQRPDSELAAVHDQFPDLQTLAGHLGGDPYRREAVMARAHMDSLAVLLGLDRKKCVIVDLDGVLWPGVLAETGSPFAWTPEISSANSHVGLYFGIHEALLALRQRGVLLACVSKNDEATVRALWHYPEHYPRHRLLTPDSFVTLRINWQDKAENIRSIAEELGFATEAFVFIDDTARERERVRQTLPGVAVLGEDLFTLRRALLTDPRLQAVQLTTEAGQRTDLVRAQLDRTRLRTQMPSEAAFIASLEVVCAVERAGTDPAVLDRVRELFERTTQFNATGRRFTRAELQGLIGALEGGLFVLRMRDRFTDHGLVGAAVLDGGEILNVVLSCRVIGLGGEHALLAAVVADAAAHGALAGRIVATDRNTPARHLYRDAGFCDEGQGRWALPRQDRSTRAA